MTDYVEVRYPGVLNKNRTEIPMGTIVPVSDLQMNRRSLPNRIQQGWFVARSAEEFQQQKSKGAAPPPAAVTPLGDGVPTPDEVGRLAAEMGETAAEDAPEEPEPPEEDEDTLEGDEPPEGVLEAVDAIDLPEVPAPDLESLAEEDISPEVPAEEDPHGVLGEPTRDDMTIEEYWTAATKQEGSRQKRLCPYCGEARFPKSALFECCEDSSEWGLRE